MQLQLASNPAGIALTAGNLTGPTPFGLTAIKGGSVTLAAPATAVIGGDVYDFKAWSDGEARVHSLVATNSRTLTATYDGPLGEPEGPESEGPAVPDPAGSPVKPSGVPVQSPVPSAPPVSPVISGHPPKRSESTVARFEFDSTTQGAGYACKLDDGPLAPCRSPRAYKALKPGRHVFRAFAEAPGDSVEYSPATLFRWRVVGRTR